MVLLLLLALVFVPFAAPANRLPPSPRVSRGMLCEGVRADEGLCKLCNRGKHKEEDRVKQVLKEQENHSSCSWILTI